LLQCSRGDGKRRRGRGRLSSRIAARELSYPSRATEHVGVNSAGGLPIPPAPSALRADGAFCSVQRTWAARDRLRHLEDVGRRRRPSSAKMLEDRPSLPGAVGDLAQDRCQRPEDVGHGVPLFARCDRQPCPVLDRPLACSPRGVTVGLRICPPIWGTSSRGTAGVQLFNQGLSPEQRSRRRRSMAAADGTPDQSHGVPNTGPVTLGSERTKARSEVERTTEAAGVSRSTVRPLLRLQKVCDARLSGMQPTLSRPKWALPRSEPGCTVDHIQHTVDFSRLQGRPVAVTRTIEEAPARTARPSRESRSRSTEDQSVFGRVLYMGNVGPKPRIRNTYYLGRVLGAHSPTRRDHEFRTSDSSRYQPVAPAVPPHSFISKDVRPINQNHQSAVSAGSGAPCSGGRYTTQATTTVSSTPYNSLSRGRLGQRRSRTPQSPMNQPPLKRWKSSEIYASSTRSNTTHGEKHACRSQSSELSPSRNTPDEFAGRSSAEPGALGVSRVVNPPVPRAYELVPYRTAALGLGLTPQRYQIVHYNVAIILRQDQKGVGSRSPPSLAVTDQNATRAVHAWSLPYGNSARLPERPFSRGARGRPPEPNSSPPAVGRSLFR
jgi:hypothetical protein